MKCNYSLSFYISHTVVNSKCWLGCTSVMLRRCILGNKDAIFVYQIDEISAAKQQKYNKL